jgi:acyl-coenzyme A synthetase/AMP-(fatty) acid ligase
VSAQSWWGDDLLNRSADDMPWARGATTVTFGRMRAETAWLRRMYGRAGIGARNTVALHGTPSFTQLWSVFALWSLGAQVITLPQRGDLAEVLTEARPEFHVSFGQSDRAFRPFADECEVMVRRRSDGRGAVTEHCLVQLSSGTTGRGKLIGRSADSLLVELHLMSTVDGLPAADDRVLLLDSVAQSFGLVGGVLHGMNSGAMMMFPRTFDPKKVLPAARDAQFVIGSPSSLGQLATPGARSALPDLRAAISGGEVLHPHVFERFQHVHGVRIGQAYGTTETGLIAADPVGTYEPPSVGVPVRGLRVRVERGVLEVHMAQSPYLYDQSPWLGGWMSTRDLVALDPVTGELRLRGRADVVPADHTDLDLLEIERVLHSHRHVREAIVLGTEHIEAHVVGSPALDNVDLLAWCRTALGRSRAPVSCHVVAELPRTANGKYVRDRELIRTARTTTGLSGSIEGIAR